MLIRCSCNGSASLLPCAKSIPFQSNRCEDDFRIRNFRRGIGFDANIRRLSGGGLYGGSSSWRCATSARPPPNFGGDDSPGSLSRFQEELSKIQDRVRIFLAVLFWMSLFFWSSAWDGTDDSRNKKGPRFGKKFK